MARTIAQRELRNDNAQVIDAVVLRRDLRRDPQRGPPVAELRPIQRPRRNLVPKADLLAIAASGAHIDAKQFRSDLARFVERW